MLNQNSIAKKNEFRAAENIGQIDHRKGITYVHRKHFVPSSLTVSKLGFTGKKSSERLKRRERERDEACVDCSSSSLNIND